MHFRTLSRIWIEYQIFYKNLHKRSIYFFLQLHLVGTISESGPNSHKICCFVFFESRNIRLSETALIMKHDWLCLVCGSVAQCAVKMKWQEEGERKLRS